MSKQNIKMEDQLKRAGFVRDSTGAWVLEKPSTPSKGGNPIYTIITDRLDDDKFVFKAEEGKPLFKLKGPSNRAYKSVEPELLSHIDYQRSTEYAYEGSHRHNYIADEAGVIEEGLITKVAFLSPCFGDFIYKTE